MDLVIAVICCNCAMAIVILVITLWTIRFRRQLIGLTNFCDRCLNEWNRLSSNTPVWTKIAASRSQFQQISQIYQQQIVALDRVRALQSMFGIARFLLFKRR
jgi:hypothetical protein